MVSRKILHFAVICICLQTANSQIEIKGKAYLGNCMPDISSAKEQYFLQRNGFTLTALLDEPNPNIPDPISFFDLDFTAERWSSFSDPAKAKPTKYSLKKFVTNKGAVIQVPPYQVENGLYKVTMTATSRFGKDRQTRSSTCYFFVKPLGTVVVIEGGVYRMVPENTDIVVDATKSLNLDKPLDSGNLEGSLFTWKCTQKSSYTFCKKKHLCCDPRWTVPKEELAKDDVVNFTLSVTNTARAVSTARQTVEVVPNCAVLMISCAKNCPPVTDFPNVQKLTMFRIACEQNCREIRDDDYEWDVEATGGDESFKFDPEKHSEGGRVGKNFKIRANVLKPNTEYMVTVKLKPSVGRPGKAKMTVKYAVIPIVDSCSIDPPVGRTLITWFRLKCEEAPPPDKNNFYKLLITDKKNKETETVVRGFYPHVFLIDFLLPSTETHELKVRVAKGEGPAIYLDVSANVTATSGDKNPRDNLDIYVNFINGTRGKGVSELLLSKNEDDVKKGVKMFQALVNEIVFNARRTNDTFEFSKKMTYVVVDDLLKSPPENPEYLLEMSDSISKLIEHSELTEEDTTLAMTSTALCRLMVTKYGQQLKSQKFPFNADAQFSKIGNVLTRCIEANVHENWDLVRRIERNITKGELPSIPLDTDIIEDYPDYVDFGDEYRANLENLNAVTSNILNSTAVAAKSLAYVTAIGENLYRKSGNFSGTIIYKDTGINLAKTSLNLLNITLIPSRDFEKNDHPFDILLSIWSRDLMWWNHARTRIATSLVRVQFWHSTCKKRIKNFKAPVRLTLNIKPDIDHLDVRIVRSNVSVPPGYAKMSLEELNPIVRVHRLGIPAGSAAHVTFQNISDTDRFDVTFTYEYPSAEDFVNNVTVSNNTDSRKVINYEYSDVWGYVGVLPSKKQPSSGSAPIMFYSVNFVTSFCVLWDEKTAKWERACWPGLGSSLKAITCECRHFSGVAGYLQNTESEIQVLQTVEILIEMQVCYIIFTAVLVTFLIYCLLVIPVAFRKQSQIYYLSDNVQDHLYAYLIIVRTENKRNAGTTSNVTIKLYGSKRTSEPHVLNYPDPKMRLLQKHGEDIFVLTTQNYLGTIVKIELWYDCSGPSPSWRCRDIVVYDMQKNLQWYFKVKQNFAVIKTGVTFLSITPTETLKERGFCNRFRICNHFHTWQLWSGEKNFSFVARTTVCFSNLLMVYMLMLALEGVPELELRDCFDKYEKFHITEYHLLRVLLCGFVVFVVHITIAWAFRFSSIEYSTFDKTYTRTYKFPKYCWLVLFLFIGISTTFLIVFGFWVPVTSSLVWLVCCFLAIVFQIVILENLFIIIQTFFCKFKLTVKIGVKYDAYLKMIAAQRFILYRRFTDNMLRPLMTHLYKPLEKMEIIRRRIVVQLRRDIYNDLEDLFLYGIYNIILYILVLVNKGKLTITAKEEVESIIEGKHTRTLPFSRIRALFQVYDYINTTLIPSLHPIFWYANYSVFGSGLMIDTANKFIGVVRLRQHRMNKDICRVPDQMKFLNQTCTPEFSMAYTLDKTFGPKWTEKVSNIEYNRLDSIFDYKTESETATWGKIGLFSTYSGGGYVAYLGRTLYNSYANLWRLVENFWIDRNTRSLSIEFLIYNANYNVFVAVQLLFELSATGYTSSMTEVSVVRMLYVQNEVELATMVFFIIFFVWVFLLMIKLIVDIVKHIEDFYKRVWLMIDLAINVMSIAGISIFIVRMQMVESYLKSLEEKKHNTFVPYFTLLYVEEFLTYLVGIIVCVATVRLWKFLRFGLFFRITERTLSMSAFPLVAVSLAFFVILTAFGLSGLFLWGDEFPELSDFVKIVAALIQMALKPDQFDITQYLDVSMSYYYFSLYLLLMQIILFVYIIVIIMSYMKAQLEFSVEPDSYTVSDYIKERIDYIPKLMKSKMYRLRGGERIQSPVTPKADEFRYANSLLFQRSRISSMGFIISCIIRNMNQSSQEQSELTEHEAQMMLGVCKSFVLHSYEDDDLELFFKGHFEGQNMKVVDEQRITKMAQFVELMFREKREVGEFSRGDPNLIRCSKMARRKNNMLKKWKLTLQLASLKLEEADQKVDNVGN